MKKLLLLLFTSLIFLAGCGDDTASTTDLEGTTIKIATNAVNEDNPSSDEAIEGADARLEDKTKVQQDFINETGVTLEFMELPEEDELETITQSVLAGDPVADVVRVSSSVYTELVKSDMLTDLTDLVDAEIATGEYSSTWAFDAGQVFDKHYGVSRDMAPTPEMLAYDLNLLEKAGMEKTPLQMYYDGEWTWENARQYFLDVQSALGDDVVVWAGEPYFIAKYGIASNGIVPIQPDGTVNLTDDKVYEALDFYKGLYDDGIIEFYFDENGDTVWGGGVADWESSTAAFTTLEMWRSDCCIKNTDKEYGFVPYPVNEGVDPKSVSIPAGTGDMYVVPKGVENPEASFAAAMYLNRQANTENFVEGMDVTAKSIDWMTTNSSEDNNGQAFADLKLQAVPDLSSIFYGDIDFSMTQSVTDYFVNGDSISSAFESGSELIEANIENLKSGMDE